MSQGVDLSHYNGPVNWAALKADAVPFVLGKVNEGDDPAFVDPMWPSNRAGALAEGIPVGGYHWGRTQANPASSAALFTQHLAYTTGMICAFLDFEATTLDPAGTVSWMDQWLAAYGRPAGLYTYAEFWDANVAPALSANDQTLAKRPLWLARYAPAIGAIAVPWSEVAIWQDTDHNTLPGITGPVDGDILVSETVPQLVAFGAGLPLKPPATQGDPVNIDELATRLDQLAAAGALDNIFKRFLTVQRDLYAGQAEHNDLDAIRADADALAHPTPAVPAATPAESVSQTAAVSAPVSDPEPPAPAA